MVDSPGGTVVVDTKWKDPTRAPSGPDVHQMLVYGQAYRAARVILIYPWHEAIGAEGTHRRWTVTGGGYGFEVATVNVGRPGEVQQSLRQLIS